MKLSLFSIIVAWGIAVASFASRFAIGAELPNIVLLMCDDLGWGDVGFNGSQVIRTPHLDEMARMGLRFDRFYAAAPVCSPTRGSCLTGRHPFRYGILYANSGHMRPQELTLAELLKAHGYATGHFGKWHLGTLTKTKRDANRGGPRHAEHYSPPWEHGFDTCFSTESKVPTFDPLLRPRGDPSGTWWDPVRAESAVAYGTAYWTNGREVTDNNMRGDDSRIIMDRAIPFMREAARMDLPFFAVIWFHAPHLPVVAGPEHTKPYAAFDKHRQHYYGCITAMDEQVGRLRRELRELRVVENTLVLFCSDNGPEGNDSAPGSTAGLRGRKRSLFEGGVRVPALAEWPARIQPGTATDVPACTSDYLPTILEVIGADIADQRPMDGVSLLPLWTGAVTRRAKPIAFESRGQLALHEDRYKIIRQPRAQRDVEAGTEELDPAEFMLFDLVADSFETTDIAQDHPQRVAEMVRRLQAWRVSCRDSLDGRDYQSR